jgi:hypothetical protein
MKAGVSRRNYNAPWCTRCLDPRSSEAQETAARTARSRLQLALHAQRDPLRDEIREVGWGLSLADTQTGRYGAALLKTTVMCEAWRRRTIAPRDPSRTCAFCDFGQS